MPSLRVVVVAAAVAVTAGVSLKSAQQPTQPPLTQQPPLPPLVVPMPDILKAYAPVTSERLRQPADGEWPMIRRTYDGWGYSPLEQITPANVASLRPAWVFSTAVGSGHEAAPVVVNGVMFVSTPGHRVVAIDARTGELLWRYIKEVEESIIAPHPTTRGIAVYGTKVFFAANDATLVALDARTGSQAWTAKVAENKDGYYMTLAPLVANGTVMVGASGGELGIRGFVAAYDAESGKPLWRTYMVPAPGEPGSETWPKGEQWKNGGAPVWVTGNYDPATNLAFFGTGNGGPWMGDQRPGDNLYTASTVALDVATGRIRGHFQYHPNDSWDWDEVSPPILVDFQRGGRTVKGLIDVARNGYLWFLERTDGPIKFVEGKPYVRQTAFRSLDPVTGRPDVDPARKPGTSKTADICPSHWGGKNWPPIAFSPKTRMIYIPANENLCGTLIGRPATYKAGSSYTGATSTLVLAEGADHIGEVQAWHVDTGRRTWMHPFPASANWGPMLATGGGVVFSGGTADRKFRAFDAASGKVLWEFPTSSGITGQPSSFAIDGTQYIAVQAGWGVDARAMQARLNRLQPGKFPEVPEGGSIWVFALPR